MEMFVKGVRQIGNAPAGKAEELIVPLALAPGK